MKELSILIPARNEKYLQQTIDDIQRHKEVDTEILVGRDEKPIGQRAMTNQLARQSTARYVMKLDAHCSFQQGFDRILIESMDDRTVMTPMLCRLDAKNWQIIPKPFTKKYYFDANLVFQYCKEDTEWGLIETMGLQGSCFIVSRKNYWKWNLCDEKYGSWGAQGSEVAIKTWLNGGRVVTNTDVFYGHLFRGQGQNVTEIPYERKSEDAKRAYDLLKNDYLYRIGGLVEKFNYPGDWTPEKVKQLCTYADSKK